MVFDIQSTGFGSSGPSYWIVAHFAFDSPVVAPAAAGYDALVEYFIKNHFMVVFSLLRGE